MRRYYVKAVKTPSFLRTLWRIITFPLYAKRRKYMDDFPSYEKKKDNRVGIFVGYIIRLWRHVSTFLRMRRYMFKIWKKDQMQISLTLVRYGVKILYPIIVIFVLGCVLEMWIPREWIARFLTNTLHLNLPDEAFIKLILEIIFAGATALFGIIFALYIVAFETATNRYSSEVVQFIREEPASSHVFKMFTSTAVLALLTLFQMQLMGAIPILTTTIVIVLALLSIASLLVLKNHMLVSTTPKIVFERLQREIIEIFDDVASEKRMELKLPSTLSHSHARKKLTIMNSLIDDLMRLERYQEAGNGIFRLCAILREYVELRHQINPKVQHWWFPAKQLETNSNNLIEFTFKANFESLGIGNLYQTGKDETWLEDAILSKLRAIAKSHGQKTTIGTILSQGYAFVLSGTWESDHNDQIISKVRGAINLQNVSVAHEALKDLLTLRDYLSQEVHVHFLNSLSEVRVAIIDGFSTRLNNKDIRDWREVVEVWMDKLYQSPEPYSEAVRWVAIHKEIKESDLPYMLRKSITEAAEQLETEELCEGEIVTPKEWLNEKVKADLAKKEEEQTQKLLQAVLDCIEQILKKADAEETSGYLEFLYFIFKQLGLQKPEMETHLEWLMKQMTLCIEKLDAENLRAAEFESRLEQEILEAIVRRRKKILVYALAGHLLLTLKTPLPKEEVNRGIARIRFYSVLGGLAFLVSELDQDTSYLSCVWNHLSRTYRVEYMSSLLNIGQQFRIESIFRETTKYDHFFRLIAGEIMQLEKRSGRSGRSIMGFGDMHPVHVSSFISSMRLDHMGWTRMEIDDCIEAFIEWVQRKTLIPEQKAALRYRIASILSAATTTDA